MCSENCTPASLPVEDGQEFGTLATLATFAGSQKQDGATGCAGRPADCWRRKGNFGTSKAIRNSCCSKERLNPSPVQQEVRGPHCCSVGIRERYGKQPAASEKLQV